MDRSERRADLPLSRAGKDSPAAALDTRTPHSTASVLSHAILSSRWSGNSHRTQQTLLPIV